MYWQASWLCQLEELLPCNNGNHPRYPGIILVDAVVAASWGGGQVLWWMQEILHYLRHPWYPGIGYVGGFSDIHNSEER